MFSNLKFSATFLALHVITAGTSIKKIKFLVNSLGFFFLIQEPLDSLFPFKSTGYKIQYVIKGYSNKTRSAPRMMGVLWLLWTLNVFCSNSCQWPLSAVLVRGWLLTIDFQLLGVAKGRTDLALINCSFSIPWENWKSLFLNLWVLKDGALQAEWIWRCWITLILFIFLIKWLSKCISVYVKVWYVYILLFQGFYNGLRKVQVSFLYFYRHFKTYQLPAEVCLLSEDLN